MNSTWIILLAVLVVLLLAVCVRQYYIIKQLREKEIKQKELLEEWGRNARRLSVEVYDKAKLSAQVAEVLEKTFINLMK